LPTIGELQNGGGNERLGNAGNQERLLQAARCPSPKISDRRRKHIDLDQELQFEEPT
jgi:hypothetical protein